MAWSAGVFSRLITGGWTTDKATTPKITAVRHDINDNDFVAGINACIAKDGSNAFTGSANLGSQKIINLADGTANTDGVNVEVLNTTVATEATARNAAILVETNARIAAIAAALVTAQSGSMVWGGTATYGSGNYAITLTPAPSLVAGTRVMFIAGATSTAASTLTVNGSGGQIVFAAAGGRNGVVAGHIQSGQLVSCVFDGTYFILENSVCPGGAWTPTITANTGNITNLSITEASWQLVGNRCEINLRFSCKFSVAWAGPIFTLPIASNANWSLSVQVDSLNSPGYANCYANDSAHGIIAAANGFMVSNAVDFNVSGSYRIS